MGDSQLPTPSQDDIDNMAEHLRGLGQRADPELDPDEVYIWVDNAITIIQWMSKHQDVEHLLTECFLYPKRLSIEIRYGRYVLVYHHESDANKTLNIVGCDVRDEDQFGALRAKTLLYAQWIREIEADELTARQLEEAEKS